MKKLVTKIFSLSIMIVALSFNGNAQNWNQLVKIAASDRASDDAFGYHLSLDGNRAAISSIDDEDETGGATMLDAGTVYILEMQNGNWTQTAKIVASDRAAGDRFGCRVSLDGDRLLVGAFLKDTDGSGANALNEAGAAYIFDYNGTNWVQTAILTASDRAMEDRFGFGIALEGDKAVIGSYLNDSDESGSNQSGYTNAGAAYVFELIGGIWTQTAKIVASNRVPADLFGYSVAIENQVIMIGAYQNSTDASGQNGLTQAGSVYVFEKVGGTWVQTSKLVASNREDGDRFGFSLAMSGNKAVIGAYNRDNPGKIKSGIAYAFERIGGVWTEKGILIPSDAAAFDEFGYSVGISGDNIVVGARNEDENASGANTLTSAGSAYVFNWDGSSWIENQKIVAPDRAADDQFGTNVSINGNLILVCSIWDDEDATGANTLNNSGSVYLFNQCGSIPTVSATGNTLTANVAGATYQWLDCDNNYAVIPSATSQMFTASQSGNYAVSVTIGNCVDTSACQAINFVGLKDVTESNSINVYPNPTSSTLVVSGISENTTYSIIDLFGKEILNGVLNENEVINIETFTKGVYLIHVKTTSGYISTKFIKE